MYQRYSPTFRTCLLVLAANLMLIAPNSYAKTYFYLDENGQAVFSQFPPKDNRDSKIIKPPPPPAEPEKAQKKLLEQRQYFQDKQKNKAIAEKKAAEDKKNSDAKSTNCERAKHNLNQYETGGPRRYRDKNGDYVRYDDDALNEKKAEQQKLINENC